MKIGVPAQGSISLDRVNEIAFRDHLRAEYLKRQSKNPQYSLRSFARALKIEPSVLSKILRGERSISQAMFEKLVVGLEMNAGDMKPFLKRAVDSNEINFESLELDTFQVISDWFHFAILELTQVESFQSRPQWIAKALGLTVAETRLALERLQRIGLIMIGEDGIISSTGKNLSTVNHSLTTVALQKMQKQVLEMAIASLTTVELDHRDQSTMTMAIDRDRLPEAKRRIREFRRDLCAYLEGGKRKNEVYHFSTALYPITKLTISSPRSSHD